MAQVTAERERVAGATAGVAPAAGRPNRPAASAAQSAFSTMASAAMRSPLASTTPRARPPLAVISATSEL